jgi:recombination protein RecA
MELEQEQKDLVFGSLLGDGNLQTGTDGRTWRYRALHKKEHAEYLNHKYGLMEPFCSTGPLSGEVFDERTGKIYHRVYFNTTVHNDFRTFGNMFYVYDKKLRKMVKRVPPTPVLAKFLTRRAIAYMYMDDGALKWLGHSNAMRICTESFPKEDVTRFRNVLFDKYKIVTTQGKKTRDGVYVGDRILIPENSSVAFRDLIQPYLVDCMKYKVSDGNKGHL